MKRFNAFRRLKLWGGVLVLFFLQACAHVPEHKAPPCRQTAAACQRALKAVGQQYRTLSGHARIRIVSPDGRVSFSGDLYAQSPDKLHFDIFGFLHRPRFFLIKNGALIAWKDFGSGRHYTGLLSRCPAFPANFPFSPAFLRDFMRILFLNFPGPLTVTKPDRPESSCHFLLRCAWGLFDMRVDPLHGLPSEVIGPEGSQTPFRLTFSEYAWSPAGWIPHQVGISTRKVEMILTFGALKVNPEIPERYFIPLIPS